MDIGKTAGKSVTFSEPEKSEVPENDASWESRKVENACKRKPDESTQEAPESKKSKLESTATPVSDKSLQERDLEERNAALVEARLYPGWKSRESKANNDMDWYESIVYWMRDKGLSLESLSNKNSEEVMAFLLENEVITQSMSMSMRMNRVDLEGSPYW
ncbi:hypothetical protein [Endozoicomonas sp. 4G]|uniref:hypothetical protein n=1 Tax=Endozoicomonas sp. 4G TaxID=2872754 RepID=UPI002078D115|nr:hypothetical protein [Endozoicomonas sp. 4G]